MTFIAEETDPNGASTKITYETNQVSLKEILFDFKHFLLACSFVIDGDLVVEDYEIGVIHDDKED